MHYAPNSLCLLLPHVAASKSLLQFDGVQRMGHRQDHQDAPTKAHKFTHIRAARHYDRPSTGEQQPHALTMCSTTVHVSALDQVVPLQTTPLPQNCCMDPQNFPYPPTHPPTHTTSFSRAPPGIARNSSVSTNTPTANHKPFLCLPDEAAPTGHPAPQAPAAACPKGSMPVASKLLPAPPMHMAPSLDPIIAQGRSLGRN